MKRTRTLLTLLAAALLAAACASHPPLETVERVDLPRYMGDWHVIANIPTGPEEGAVNSIEHYELRGDGDVDITFTFYEDSLSGEFQEMHARGFVQEGTGNSKWKVQFIWPIRFPFYIMDLADDYSYTVIGLPSRDYLWIMARETSLADSTYGAIVRRVHEAGYDTSKIQQVPQLWPMDKEYGE